MGNVQNFISHHWLKLIVAILLIMIIVIVLVVQVGNFVKENTSNASENYYNAGQKAIQIVDDYLDFKFTSDEAKEKLEEIDKRLDYPDITNKTEQENWWIKIQVSSLYTDMMSSNVQSDNDILEDRNELANTLKLPQR